MQTDAKEKADTSIILPNFFSHKAEVERLEE